MNAKDAMEQLGEKLMKKGEDRYFLVCGKAVLFVRLAGARTAIQFAARDRVAFRIDAGNLTIEDFKTHVVRRTVPWDLIESMAVGEPESDNSDLFQG